MPEYAKIMCNDCRNEIIVRWGSFKGVGKKCPDCNTSLKPPARYENFPDETPNWTLLE